MKPCFVGNNLLNKCEKELHEISLASYTCFHEFSKKENTTKIKNDYVNLNWNGGIKQLIIF